MMSGDNSTMDDLIAGFRLQGKSEEWIREYEDEAAKRDHLHRTLRERIPGITQDDLDEIDEAIIRAVTGKSSEQLIAERGNRN